MASGGKFLKPQLKDNPWMCKKKNIATLLRKLIIIKPTFKDRVEPYIPDNKKQSMFFPLCTAGSLTVWLKAESLLLQTTNCGYLQLDLQESVAAAAKRQSQPAEEDEKSETELTFLATQT